MSIRKLFSTNLIGLFIVLTSIGMVACKDDEEPTIGEMIFIDLDSNLVPNVNVILQCTSSVQRPCNVYIESVTDSKGKLSKTFEEPKILNVSGAVLTDVIVAYDSLLRPIYQQDSLFVEGTINIKKFQTTRKVFQMDTLR